MVGGKILPVNAMQINDIYASQQKLQNNILFYILVYNLQKINHFHIQEMLRNIIEFYVYVIELSLHIIYRNTKPIYSVAANLENYLVTSCDLLQPKNTKMNL